MPVVYPSSSGLQLIDEDDTAIGELASSFKLAQPIHKWANHLLGVKLGGPVVMQTYDVSKGAGGVGGTFTYKIYHHQNIKEYEFVAVVLPDTDPAVMAVSAGASSTIGGGSRSVIDGVGVIETTSKTAAASRGTYIDITVVTSNMDLLSLTVTPKFRTFLDPGISDISIIPTSTLSLEGGMNPGAYIHSGGPTNAGTYDMQDVYEQMILGVAEERRVLHAWANPEGNIFITGVAWTPFFEGNVNPRQPQFTSDASFDARVYFYTIADFKGVGSQYQVRVITDTETVTSGALVNDGAYAWNFLDIKILQNAEGDALVIEALTDDAIATVAIRGYCVQRIVV